MTPRPSLQKLFAGIILASAASMTTGCSASLNKANLLASSGSTATTESEVAEIAYDDSLPTFVVAVEPFIFNATFAPEDGVSTLSIRSGGEQLAAQLTTALANAGNISVIDSGLKKKADGTFAAKLQAGEVGPFIIRATVTEFTENAETSGSRTGGSLGWVGIVGAVAGAVTNKPGLAWTGAGIAAANPTYKNDERQRKGMVGIDFRVVDGRTSRIVGGFKASGTFVSASNTRGVSLFGIGKNSHEFAQSVIGQATRAALNDAVAKINGTLATKVAKRTANGQQVALK